MTCRAAYITVMKICKLMLTTVSHAKFQVVVEACSADPQSPNITQAEHSHALILQQALQFIPNPGAEVMTRTVGLRLGQQLLDQVRARKKTHSLTYDELCSMYIILNNYWRSTFFRGL